MLVDTHAHVNFNAFRQDADAVISRALSENTWLVIVGADHKTSKRALDYANKYEVGVYAAAGLHPMHIFSFRAQSEDYDFQTRGEDFNYELYDKLVQFEKIVAVGEIGLDYYHIEGLPDINMVKNKQQEVFKEQVLLARRHDLPVIIHCRQAHGDLVALLKELKKDNRELFPKDKPWGVVHCFTENEDVAWQYFNLGLLLSFTGLITFSRQWDDLIRKLPLERMMLETDTPFLTPAPFRGQRNEPANVSEVARKMAEIKGVNIDKIAEITTRNARNLFSI
ncbi:MAG: TatD family hydrolase [Planctomycetes bacterium]|jgi:TatD DNase family protein|nr:TatD family hydrolase [Planctomycetota bacterium]